MSILLCKNLSCSYLLLSPPSPPQHWLPAQLLRHREAEWIIYLTKLTGWTVMWLSGLLFHTWDWLLKSHSTLEWSAFWQAPHAMRPVELQNSICFIQKSKKYINRGRQRGRKRERRSLRLGPVLLIIVPFKRHISYIKHFTMNDTMAASRIELNAKDCR